LSVLEDKLAIVEVVQNWAIWHDDSWMTATWFQGPAGKFIEVCKVSFDKGRSAIHDQRAR